MNIRKLVLPTMIAALMAAPAAFAQSADVDAQAQDVHAAHDAQTTAQARRWSRKRKISAADRAPVVQLTTPRPAGASFCPVLQDAQRACHTASAVAKVAGLARSR